ncbi:MAG: hypothetical protein ACPGU4_07385 [Flavobacteriales bacterium]
MKRAVILAYDFEPHNSIGAQRPLGWFKYFKQLDIHPVIITRHWDKIENPNDLVKASSATNVERDERELGTIIRVPYKPNLRDKILLNYGSNKWIIVRKLLSLVYSVGQYFFFGLDNRVGIYRAAQDYITKEGADAIIATGEPFILFRYASKLSKRFGLPWIADYRDGWSQNYGALHNAGTLQRFINLNVFSNIEKRLVKSSAAVTVTVESHKKEVQSLVPNARTEIVMNGFFEEAFQNLASTESSNKPFTIAYSGTIYPYQDLEVFLDGLEKAIDLNGFTPNDIQVVFYGLAYQPEQLSRVVNYSQNLSNYIKHTAKMPYTDAIEKLNEANVLLLLATPEKQQIYAKVFDYVALQKTILMVRNDEGPLKQILNDTPTPLVCNTAEEVCQAVTSAVQNPQGLTNVSSVSEKYSRRSQAKEMASVITSVCEV